MKEYYPMDDIFNIFYIRSEKEFNFHALEVFYYQWKYNEIYRKYCDYLRCDPIAVYEYRLIPFLPVSFFKSHDIICKKSAPVKTFYSSGTTGQIRSRHIISDLEIYRKSLRMSFERFFGSLKDYEIFALMPRPEENPASSLIFMVDEWIRESGSDVAGFFNDDHEKLAGLLKENRSGRKKLLIGLSYALLDFADAYPGDYKDVIIMETGGMKGRRKEMIKEELHGILKKAFNADKICSEYGMTELLSQAYSKGDGIFQTPPWMKVLIRDADDPFTLAETGKTGGVNIMDLANVNSCSFIAIQDLGRLHPNGTFEILGRFDDSEARGCNLMID